MAKKVLSVRVDESVMDTMSYFCGVSEMSQADFVTAAITDKCEKVQLLRCGGVEASLPNPQNFSYTDDQAAQIIEILSDTSNKITKICPSLDFGMNEIVAFATQRLFKDSDEQRKKFNANLYNDLENTRKGE